MGKGNYRIPPPIGGVVWWDKNGVRHDTRYPPSGSDGICAGIFLISFGGFLAVPGITLFAMGGVMAKEDMLLGIILGGCAFILVAGLMIFGGVKCCRKGSKDVITLYYPGTGGVPVNGVTIEPRMRYMIGTTMSDTPPPGYVPPPGVQLAEASPPAHESAPPSGRHGYHLTATAPPSEAPRHSPANASAPPPEYKEALLMQRV